MNDFVGFHEFKLMTLLYTMKIFVYSHNHYLFILHIIINIK